MKFSSSPVFGFSHTRSGSSLPHPGELLSPAPAQVRGKSLTIEQTPSGRGGGGKRVVAPTIDHEHHAPLHAPNIWEDSWERELDHHGPTLHIPAAANAPMREPGRNVVPFDPPRPPKEVPGTGRSFTESPLKRILADINARAITPRQMQELSLDLYVNGILSWDEHVELSFQAELHPDFERTIGALTGERSLPDQPRDFVKVWEQRLDFERRFAPAASRAKDRALHILSVLRRIDRPATLIT